HARIVAPKIKRAVSGLVDASAHLLINGPCASACIARWAVGAYIRRRVGVAAPTASAHHVAVKQPRSATKLRACRETALSARGRKGISIVVDLVPASAVAIVNVVVLVVQRVMPKGEL